MDRAQLDRSCCATSRETNARYASVKKYSRRRYQECDGSGNGATATGKRSRRAGSIRTVNEQTDRDSNREIAATDLFSSSFEFTPEREMFRENAGVLMSEGRAAACRSDEKTNLVKNERCLDRSIDRSMGSTRRSPGVAWGESCESCHGDQRLPRHGRGRYLRCTPNHPRGCSIEPFPNPVFLASR